MLRKPPAIALALALCLAACSGHSGVVPAAAVPASGTTAFGATGASIVRPAAAKRAALSTGTPIKHIVIIIQENRSFDNLFEGFPGANTTNVGYVGSTQIPLVAAPLASKQLAGHAHHNWVAEYNKGAMNGWPQDTLKYVQQSDIEPYWQMAQQWSLSDNMFQSNSGPSLPAHQYLLSGTAAIDTTGVLYVEGNPNVSGITTGGCASPAGTLVKLINPLTGDDSQSGPPCFDHPTMIDLLAAAGSCNGSPCTWRYYSPFIGPSLWNAPGAIKHIWDNPTLYDNVVTPNSTILTDISKGNLPSVSWVIPTIAESDHSGDTNGSGPHWVGTVVNAIGNSQYWNSTVIFVVWDDWGGWYDHVVPPIYNHYENGFRVPLITISPYVVQRGYISHVDHEFGSILHFTEEVFGLPSLSYTDARADDLSDIFNFSQTPLPFIPVKVKALTQFDEYQTGPPDDDFE